MTNIYVNMSYQGLWDLRSDSLSDFTHSYSFLIQHPRVPPISFSKALSIPNSKPSHVAFPVAGMLFLPHYPFN